MRRCNPLYHKRLWTIGEASAGLLAFAPTARPTVESSAVAADASTAAKCGSIRNTPDTLLGGNRVRSARAGPGKWVLRPADFPKPSWSPCLLRPLLPGPTVIEGLFVLMSFLCDSLALLKCSVA